MSPRRITRLKSSASDRVHPRQPVEHQHERDDEQQADGRRDHAGANRVGAQGGANGPFLQVRQRGRQRARPEHQREVLHLFLGEAAADAAVARDATLDLRSRLHAAVKDDRELAADVLARHPTELAGAFRIQREGDGRTVVLVERWTGAAQLAAGHRRRALHQVVDRRAQARPSGRSSPGGSPCPAAPVRSAGTSRARPTAPARRSSAPGDPWT